MIGKDEHSPTGSDPESKIMANKQRADNSPPRSPGRPKGSPNKTTKLLKDAIIKAAETAGEDMNGKNGLIGYCTFLATQEPKAFSQLLGKVLPMQVTGEDGGALQVTIRRYAED